MNNIQNQYTTIAQDYNGKIILNGKEITLPFKDYHNMTIINNSIFVDGYEYKNGEWVKTFRALWHKWFS